MNRSIPQLLLVGMVLVVGVGLIVGGATSGMAFGSFNPRWDGTSDLRSIAASSGSEPLVVENTSRYGDYGESDVAFVLAPEKKYSPRDVRQIRGFVERGGLLVVAARDEQRVDDLLGGVGVAGRPTGPVLRDDQSYYRSTALPVATNVSNHSLVEGVDSVTLNYGTAVTPNGSTVLVRTSAFAYLDRDGNGQLSSSETLASYPVATVEPVGDGRVVVVGDPSVFINVMQDDAENDAFVRALVRDSSHTIVDVSHSGTPPILVQALLAVRRSVVLQLGVGLGLLGVIGLASRFVPRRVELDAVDVDEARLSAGLESLYPELDSEFVERVTKGVKGVRSQSRDDE